MTTIATAWEAGVDAVIADNSLNKGGFADALRTVITAAFSDAEAKDWIDAIAVEYNRLGIINNPTYSNLRGSIINDGDIAKELFSAVATIIVLPETLPASQGAKLIDLREDRDEADAAIDRCQALIDAEPGGTVGRLVKDALRMAKDQIRGYKQSVRDQIQGITGDPDQ